MSRCFAITVTLSVLAAGACHSGDATVERNLASLFDYSMERPFTETVRTIHVEMFHTREFRRNLEFQLTEAVIKRVEMDTPYSVAPRERADSVLAGEVLAVRQGTLGRDFRTDLPIETAATFIISFRWQDARTGKILAERQRFPFTTTYIRPVGETFDNAAVRGLDGVAQRIVETMESEW